MPLFCPSCGGKIPPEDINIHHAIAKCSSCGTVFNLAERVGDQGAGQAPRERAPVPMPKNVSVEAFGPDLNIVRRWFTPGFIILLIFCILWDGFLGFWYFIAFTQEAPTIMKVFPVIHLLVGFFLTYYTVAGFLNRTELRVAGGELRIDHRPLPWFGAKSVPAHELEQLYCTEHFHTSRRGHTSRTYNLDALMRDGGKVQLLSGLPEAEQALFIELKIEEHLGIVNRRVAGEV